MFYLWLYYLSIEAFSSHLNELKCFCSEMVDETLNLLHFISAAVAVRRGNPQSIE